MTTRLNFAATPFARSAASDHLHHLYPLFGHRYSKFDGDKPAGPPRQFVQPADQKPVKAVKPGPTRQQKAPPSRLDGAEREEKLRDQCVSIWFRRHPLTLGVAYARPSTAEPHAAIGSRMQRSARGFALTHAVAPGANGLFGTGRSSQLLRHACARCWADFAFFP